MNRLNRNDEVDVEFVLPQDKLNFLFAYAAEHGTTAEAVIRDFLEDLEKQSQFTQTPPSGSPCASARPSANLPPRLA